MKKQSLLGGLFFLAQKSIPKDTLYVSLCQQRQRRSHPPYAGGHGRKRIDASAGIGDGIVCCRQYKVLEAIEQLHRSCYGSTRRHCC